MSLNCIALDYVSETTVTRILLLMSNNSLKNFEIELGMLSKPFYSMGSLNLSEYGYA